MALSTQRFIGLFLLSSVCPTGAASAAGAEETQLLIDFADSSVDLGWHVVNDDVMGGSSTGEFELTEGTLVFSGNTSTDGGGFSSIRTAPSRLDLSGRTGLRLDIKADGRRYSWGLLTNVRWRGRHVDYWADFDTLDNTWTTLTIPFSRFEPRFRGSRLNAPAFEAGQVTGMALMINDQQDGPFRVSLDSVYAYGPAPPFTLEQLRGKKHVLVLSAPTGENKDLGVQRRAVAATASEFADRDMLLVILREGEKSTAGDRKLTVGESARVRQELGIGSRSFSLRLIGKDGSVKLSSQGVTPMTQIYEVIDTMTVR
jgi:NADH dehydrogenase [ubiquinone] 1 alpha subcomplex assembly factor 1